MASATSLEAVFEELPVGVESHRRRGMTERLLDDLDVCTARNGQGRGGVA
jgi:hypothetical protein